MNSLTITPSTVEKRGLYGCVPLSTKRLIIREFQLIDADELFNLHRNSLATRYAGGTRSRDESHESLCRMINRVRETGFGTFAVQTKEHRNFIGWVGIQPLLGSERFEILYALQPKYWGLGYASEAASALLDAVFRQLREPVDEVIALVYPQNVPSIRVLEKLGFSFESYYFDEPTQRYACMYSVKAKASWLPSQIAAQSGQSSSKK